MGCNLGRPKEVLLPRPSWAPAPVAQRGHSFEIVALARLLTKHPDCPAGAAVRELLPGAVNFVHHGHCGNDQCPGHVFSPDDVYE
jgi:hypothetical protein